MAQSRKHRSKREAIVSTARVINKGGGGGELKPAKRTLEGAATDKRLRRKSSHLDTHDTKADEKRAKRIRRITDRIKNGGSLEVRR